MNNSHQQSPKENIESKCKNTRNTPYLSSTRNGIVQKFSARYKHEEDEQ